MKTEIEDSIKIIIPWENWAAVQVEHLFHSIECTDDNQ